jgi:hypothetical protein
MKKTILTILTGLGLVATGFAQGTILWDESVNGPFSFDYRSPTSLGVMTLGTNTIFGATEIEPTGPNYFVHEDYFSFAVPNNMLITSVYLTINKPNVGTWVGDATFLTQLAFVGNPSSGELLTQWGLTSIGPGTYGMYTANHDAQAFTSIADYRLDFFTQSVPEPSTHLLILAGLGLVGFRGWKMARVKS